MMLFLQQMPPLLLWTLLAMLYGSTSAMPIWWPWSSSRSPFHINVAQETCNGHASLCNRSYADVVFAGAHNSYAFGDGLSDNQYVDIDDALQQGVRLLQAQGHPFPSTDSAANPSGIALCHTSCFLQYGSTLEAWLAKARAWLDANPREVLTLLVTNPDAQDIGQWQRGFEYAGFNASNVFTPPALHIGRAQWPTLGEMIAQDRRAVVMIDSYGNFSRVPWIIKEFDNVFENPYDQLTVPFNCSRDRGRASDTLYLHNHVKDLQYVGISYPDKGSLYNVNAATNNSNAVVPTVQRCANETGVRATFVLVDFFNIPATDNVFTAVDMLNNVSSTPPASAGAASAASYPRHAVPAFASSLLAAVPVLALLSVL